MYLKQLGVYNIWLYNKNMNIILGKSARQNLGDKYIVLELDSFRIGDEIVPSYCVLDAGNIPLNEMQELPLWQENHSKLIENYRLQNWNFCEQMIEHLQNRWAGEVNSFYHDLYARIQEHKSQDLPGDWQGYIER